MLRHFDEVRPCSAPHRSLCIEQVPRSPAPSRVRSTHCRSNRITDQSTALRIGSASRCAYRAVVVGCACPSSLPMMGNPIPARARHWQSCDGDHAGGGGATRVSSDSVPGSLEIGPRLGEFWPATTYVDDRGSAARIAKAGADSTPFFLPVLDFGRKARPRSMSTSLHRRCRISRRRQPVEKQ